MRSSGPSRCSSTSTSQFARRKVEDRPLIVPHGSENYAFLGQYTEIAEDVVFTVEYSVRGAMHAVYELLGVDKRVPRIYHAYAHPKVVLDMAKKAFAQAGSPPVPRGGPARTAQQLDRSFTRPPQ